MKKVIEYLVLMEIIASGYWLYKEKTPEPFVTFIGGLIALCTLFLHSRRNKNDILMESGNQVEDLCEEAIEEGAVDEVLINPVLGLSERFIKLFEMHDIHLNEIPRVIPDEFQVTLDSLLSHEALVLKLTPSLIDWVSTKFRVRREWLEKGDERIYETRNYYKNVSSFLTLLHNLSYEENKYIEVIAVKKTGNLDHSGERNQNVNLLIKVEAFSLGNRTIFTYIPTSTLWDWGYWRSRYQLKSIIVLCSKKLELCFHGYDLESSIINGLAYGKHFPSQLSLEGSYTWYPEDYTYTDSESVQSKEGNEFQAILIYIKEQRYDEIKFGYKRLDI